MQMLQSAQQLSVAQQQQKDDSNYDYNNQLRAGIFEAYSGIFHAMGSSGNQYLQEAAKVGFSSLMPRNPSCVWLADLYPASEFVLVQACLHVITADSCRACGAVKSRLSQMPRLSCSAAQSIVSFEEVVCAEKENTMDDNAMRAGVSLLGDLATQVPCLVTDTAPACELRSRAAAHPATVPTSSAVRFRARPVAVSVGASSSLL